MERPRPQPDALTQPYWDAAAAGKLLVQRCADCGRYQWYPRAHCLECHAEPEWVEASGRGRLHTFSILHRTPNAEFVPALPYVLAIVDLDEGVRVTSNIVDVPHDEIVCEMPLRVVFRDDLPCFTGA